MTTLTSLPEALPAGAWFGLSKLSEGWMMAADDASHPFMRFLLSILDLEKSLILNCRAPEKKDQVDHALMQWLRLEELALFNSSIPAEKITEIARLLLWSALFDLHISVVRPGTQSGSAEQGTPSSLINYLPTITKKGKFQNSVSVFLELLKTRSSDAKMDSQFFKLIAKAKPEHQQHDIDPDTSALRQKFKSWKRGETRFTTSSFVESFREYLALNDDLNGIWRGFIIFINAYTRLQLDLLDEKGYNVNPSEVVAAFSTYPAFLDTVKSSYNADLKQRA